MVFPVAVGVGPCHTSSRPFPRGQNNNQDISSSNNSDKPPAVQQQYTDNVIMAIGTNADETLSATMFISYHFIPVSNPHNDTTTSSEDLDCNNEGNTQTDDNNVRNDLTNNGHTEHTTSSVEMESLLHHDTSNNNQSSKSALDVHYSINSQQFNVIAELRVQITPTTAPYVSNMDAMSSRETKSRVPLGLMRRSSTSTNSYEANPCIDFASNETHLACLIPLPSGYQLVSPSNKDDNVLPATSTIVIYRVQAQNVSYQQQLYHKKQHNLPKLPDYIVENELNRNKTDKDATENNNIQVTTKSLDQMDLSSHENDEVQDSSSSTRGNSVLYVAHEPKIVRTPQQQQQMNTPLEERYESSTKPKGSFLRQLSTGSANNNNSSIQLSTLQCATCMCTVPSDHYRGKSSLAKSFLLVGTTNGSLLLIDFSMARVQSVLLKSTPDNLEKEDGYVDNLIVHISQCTPTQWRGLDIYGEEQGSLSKGRISTVMRDGSVNIYITSFAPSSVDNWVENGIVERLSSKRDETKHKTGLEMRISLLSTYLASKSNLRHIRAKWINPILLVLLTRSPYLDEEALLQQSKSRQSEMVVAQVWTVAEVHTNKDDQSEVREQANGWRCSSDTRANIALISELKMPCGDSLDELVHDTFSLSREASESTRSDDRMTVFTKCARGMSITYHSGTDCLALNSLAVTRERSGIKVRPFCLIWDWKRNVPGLTLASSTSYCLCPQQQIDTDDQIMAVPSLYSWFQLGQDEKYGLVAVHVYITTSGKITRARKNIYSLSTLSPLSRSIAEDHNLNLAEPSAILLHHDSVTFPVLSRSSNSENMTLQWEESSVPATYIASNGPCQKAAVGKDYGRAIAVASSRGLCVLDLSRMPRLGNEQGDVVSLQTQPRWKLFSNINDEHRFSIESMSWWECGCGEDFLLAVVQYTNIESLHLVCWSRKSLGFGSSQLLRESSNSAIADYGFALPSGFRIQSMSIMKDPSADATNCLSNRALLLLSYVSSHEGDSGSSIKYAVYQLQTKQSSNGKIGLVLARNTACGRIPLQLGKSPDLFAVETVTSIFLAGGSFAFDLDDTGDEEGEGEAEIIAMVGITTLYQGLVAVCLSSSGPTLYRPSLLDKSMIDESSSMGHRKSFIVTYWVSGTISNENGCRVAWNIAKNDGKVYCWSVPCRTMKCTLLGQNQSSQYHSPGFQKHSVIGEICHLGQSSLWMNGATNSEHEISLGPYRPLDFGCVLYAGQRSRKRTSSEGPASFHVTSCTIGPPQFTPFLYVSFLDVSSSSSTDSEMLLINHSDKGIINSQDNETTNILSRNHINSTLHQVKGLGSSSSALRIITFKVVQLLDAGKDTSWSTGKAILTEIVSVVKEMYDPLGFATFFLSIGRQLEPHQFNLIFPLPSDDSPPVLRTAEDLFYLACSHGSLATAVSALPLFSSHEVSQQSVVKLIYHCLIKIEENVQSYYSHTILTSGEDESYLHQLFWFGVKLEDALEIERSYVEDDEGNQSEVDNYSTGSSQSSISASSSTTNHEESSSDDNDSDEETDQADYTFDTYSSDDDDNRGVSFLTPCRSRTPKKKPRVGIVKKVVKRLFPSANNSPVNNSKEEGAIHDAASSFILNGFDELPSAKNLKEASDEELLADTSVSTHVSVGGTICLFLNHLVTSGEDDSKSDQNQGWKVLSVVARLLQGDRETSAITSAASANAQRVAGRLTVQDFQSITSNNGDEEEDVDKAFGRIASHLVNITSDCHQHQHQQINSQAVDTVFNLILLLLLRYDACQDVQRHKVALIAIGIVSGHLSGRINELLGENCDISIIPCRHRLITYSTHCNY